MSTRMRNKLTGEELTTSYSIIEGYYPWEVIRDTSAEVALKRVLKAVEHKPISLDDDSVDKPAIIVKEEVHESDLK